MMKKSRAIPAMTAAVDPIRIPIITHSFFKSGFIVSVLVVKINKETRSLTI